MRRAMKRRGITGKMKSHVAFVAVAEIGDGIFRPLIGFRQQHAVAYFSSTCLRSSFKAVGFRQVLTVGALALIEVRHSIKSQAINAHVEPEIHGGEHGLVTSGLSQLRSGWCE